MNKLLKGILWAIGIEVAAVAVFWAAIRVTGTGWVWPFLALVALPLLLCTFPEKKPRPRRGGVHEAETR